MKTSRKRQLIGGLALTGALAVGGVAVTQLGGDETSPTRTSATVGDDSVTTTPVDDVLSAADGAAARARLASLRPGASLAEAATAPDLALATSSQADSIAADSEFFDCGVPWVPSPEEIESSNADADGLAAALDAAGVNYSVFTDDNGFHNIEYDYDDAAAEEVASSYWNDRYPPEPISPEELAQNKAENDVIANALDAAGVAFTRVADVQGWERLDYDYEDPAAQLAVDAAYAELFPPEPPTAEDLAFITEENDRIAAAFDAAGVVYTRKSDAVGWEWIEWDFEDGAMTEKALAAFETLYPTDIAIDPIAEPIPPADPVDDEIAIDLPEGDIDDIAIEPGIDCGEIIDVNDPAVSFVTD